MPNIRRMTLKKLKSKLKTHNDICAVMKTTHKWTVGYRCGYAKGLQEAIDIIKDYQDRFDNGVMGEITDVHTEQNIKYDIVVVPPTIPYPKKDNKND